MVKKSGNSNTKIAVEVGLGLAAIASAAAGAYFLYGKNGAKNRKKVKSWMLKAKAEALEQMEKAKDISEGAYNEIVDKVSKKYSALKDIDSADVAELGKELKGYWKEIKKHIAQPKKKTTAKKK